MYIDYGTEVTMKYYICPIMVVTFAYKYTLNAINNHYGTNVILHSNLSPIIDVHLVCDIYMQM